MLPAVIGVQSLLKKIPVPPPPPPSPAASRDRLTPAGFIRGHPCPSVAENTPCPPPPAIASRPQVSSVAIHVHPRLQSLPARHLPQSPRARRFHPWPSMSIRGCNHSLPASSRNRLAPAGVIRGHPCPSVAEITPCPPPPPRNFRIFPAPDCPIPRR